MRIFLSRIEAFAIYRALHAARVYNTSGSISDSGRSVAHKLYRDLESKFSVLVGSEEKTKGTS